MELRHLRYFVAVAETLHFGRAANRLHMSQPTLSQQIRQLESELQAALLVRTKRRVELTDAGRLFLEEARDILAHVDQAAINARRAGARDIRLRVGTGYCMDQMLLVSAVEVFNRLHPDALVEVVTMSVQRQTDALRQDRLDVALVRSTDAEPPLTAAELLREPLFVALPPKHRLARRERIPLPALAGEAFVLVPRDTVPVYHEMVVSLCRRAGFVPEAAREADHLQLLLMMVAAGSGVSLVPACARAIAVNGLILRPIDDPDHSVKTAIAWREDALPAVREFVDTVREVAARRAA